MKWQLFDFTPDPVAPRASLAGSRGLLSDRAQRVAESEHDKRVFREHGLTSKDLHLMGRAWCVKYVNARRSVERMLVNHSRELAETMDRLFECPNTIWAYNTTLKLRPCGDRHVRTDHPSRDCADDPRRDTTHGEAFLDSFAARYGERDRELVDLFRRCTRSADGP